jgi:hypothetical protein
MNKTKLPYYEIFSLIIGELAVSLITVAVYLIIDKFDYKVISGVLLGSAVTVLNFLFLAISTTRAVNAFMLARGECEMTEEESAAFVAEHQAKIQNSIKLSYIIRTLSMLITLVLAFLLDFFAVVATVVPLLMFRPITMISALIKRKVIGNNEL